MPKPGQKPALIATVVAVAVVAFVFVPMITWYTGGAFSGGKETRSLIEHALWWIQKKGWNWSLPMVAVASGPALVAIAELAPLRAGPRAVLAVTAAAIACGWFIVASAGVGEDIVKSWIRMPGPLAALAAVTAVYACLRVTVWRARRAA